MKSAYALHELVFGKEDRRAPGSVITDVPEKTYAELELLGAIREATEDEVTLSGQPFAADAEPAAAAEVKPEVKPEAPAKPKTKAEKKAEADAAAAAAKAEADAAAKAEADAAAAQAEADAAAAAAAAAAAGGKTDQDPDVTKPSEDDLLGGN